MKLVLKFYCTPLIAAVSTGNIEIINLLFSNKNIDVNLPCIFKLKKIYRISK